MNKSKIQVQPKKVYIIDKFEKIKHNLRSENIDTEDMGSFIVINFDNYSFILNQILCLDIYLNKFDSKLNTRVSNVENSIKNCISEFEFNYNYN